VKIENLKIFLEVAQSESINEAARNLFMTHQNLNKIIKNLEAELNTQLFVRTNKGIQLTSNGKELFVTASQIVKNYDSFLEKLHNTDTEIIKFYTLASQSTLANTLQGQRFGERYLSVHKRDFDEIIKMIQQGKTGIYFLPIRESEQITLPRETGRYIITSSDFVTYVCHKNYTQQYQNSQYSKLDKLISNTAKQIAGIRAINIDDIQISKKLMRDEGFAYSTEYQMFLAEFPEDEWVVFNRESMPEFRIAYTLFFNLPDTPTFQQLQEDIIKTVESFFSISPSINKENKSIDATL